MTGFMNRMLRATKLEVGLYEEIERDTAAMGQAMGVVVLSGLAAGIAHYSVGGFTGMVSMTVGAIIGWFIWAYVTYLVGTKLLPDGFSTSSRS